MYNSKMKANSFPSQDIKEPTQVSRWDTLIDSDNNGIGEASDDERERHSAQKLTQELFDSFMDSLPEDVNPAEYANSPDGYLGFFNYIADELDRKYPDAGQDDQAKLFRLFYEVMYEYSDDYMDRGGKIPNDFDDLIFFGDNGGGEEEILAEVQAKYSDTIERMRENRLEQLPGEFDDLVTSFQSQIQEYYKAGPNEIFSGEFPDYNKLLSSLKKYSNISTVVGDKIDIASIMQNVHDRIVPELLPRPQEWQNGVEGFPLLVQLAEHYPDSLKNTKSAAIDVARFAAKRNLERWEDVNNDFLVDMMRDYVYEKIDSSPLEANDKLSEDFKNSVFFGIDNASIFSDEDYYAGKRDAIAEVIGPERYDAINFVAQQINSRNNNSYIRPFYRDMPVVAEIIARSRKPELVKKAYLEKMNSDTGKVDKEDLLILRKVSLDTETSVDDATEYAKKADLYFGGSFNINRIIGSGEKSLDQLENIQTVFDFLLEHADDPIIDSLFKAVSIGNAICSRANGLLPENGAWKKNTMGIVSCCSEVESESARKMIAEFMLEDKYFANKEISQNSIDGMRDMVLRVNNSNSLELRRIMEPLIRNLLDATEKTEDNNTISYNIDDSKEKLSSIEKIFLTDSLPSLAKKFLVFETMYPIDKFNEKFIDKAREKVSPTLAQISERDPRRAYALILRDLVKNGVESNSLELRKYLENLEQGQRIMDRIGSGDISFDQLNKDEQTEVRRFVNQLVAGHNQTTTGRKEVTEMLAQGGVHSEDEVPDGSNWLYHNMPITADSIKRINAAFETTRRYSASDRLVRQFAYFNGYTGVHDMLAKMDEIRDMAEMRNIETASRPFVVHAGDIVKNVNGKYLDTLLGDGTNCKEFLGASADSDQTPLDSDFTFVEKEASIANCDEIQGNPNGNYGYVWYVSHVTPDRYRITRKNDGQPGLEEEKPDIFDTRMELFRTLVENHYGVRTGIGSTNIDALIIDQAYEHVDKTAFRVVKNGFYIPIYDKETGDLIFTPEDYKEMRTRLSGNHEYRTGEYQRASEVDLATDANYTSNIEINVAENEAEVVRKNSTIMAAMTERLVGTGLQFREHIDADLTPGFIEVSNTGSTGRGTNVPGDGDFDYVFRVDREIFEDSSRLNELSQRFLGAIKLTQNSEVRKGEKPADIRTKHVHVNGMEDEVDIDITFVQRTDQLTYATEDCVSDYLSNFNEEERTQVVKNIIAAKKMFKKYECYKPKHAGGKDESGKPLAQGGLGGVGVENWILQNGGSLSAAARSFLVATGVYGNPSATPKPFEQFIKDYQIWDLGSNHKAEERNSYPHDNFIMNNLSADGYQKIIFALLAEGFGSS